MALSVACPGRAELGFVVQADGQAAPVEAKAEKNLKAESFKVFSIGHDLWVPARSDEFIPARKNPEGSGKHFLAAGIAPSPATSPS